MSPLAWRPWRIGRGDTCHVEGRVDRHLRTARLSRKHTASVLTSSLPAATSFRSKSPALKWVQPNCSTIFAHCVPFPALLSRKTKDPNLGTAHRDDQTGHFFRAALTLAPRGQKQSLWIQCLPFVCAYTDRGASRARRRRSAAYGLSAGSVEGA